MSDSTPVENVLDSAHGLPRVPGARAAGNHVREGAALSAVPGLTPRHTRDASGTAPVPSCGGISA